MTLDQKVDWLCAQVIRLNKESRDHAEQGIKANEMRSDDAEEALISVITQNIEKELL